jgi:lambda family phage portal protein
MAQRGRPPKPETLVARAAVAAFQQAQGTPLPQQPTGKLGAMRRFRAKYDAAGMGRRMVGWNPPSSGPNAVLTGLQNIRNRSRDASRNDWSGASVTQKWTTNLIGIGIVPRFKRIKSKERRRQLVDLWNDHVADCDADSTSTFYGLQTLVVRNWFDAGEVFIRQRPRFDDEGFTVPLQYQVLEAEMCPLFDATSFEGLPDGNYIRQGVEFNKRGRRIAYWFYKDHPGDAGPQSVANIGASVLVRVAASQVTHVFEPLRPGQIRGVSLIAPVLARLRNIENYDDATLTRQQLANMLVAFIIRKLPPMTGDEDLDAVTSPLTGGDEGEEGFDDVGRPLVGLQPGLVQELDDGQEVQWSNPPEAGTTYSDYMRTQHLGTAAGASLPYELFSGDIANVSDRTLRVIINEFRRLAEQRQWQIVIPKMCVVCLRWFCDAALLQGDITVAEYDDIRRAEWAPHGWTYIHPVQDPQGKQIEVDAGFRSRSSVIGERGDDPDEVDEERAADKEREDELGLTPPPPVAPGAAGGQQPGQGGSQDEQDERDDQQEQQTSSLLTAFARLEGRLSAPAAAAPAPAIHVEVNMPAMSVEPPQVTVNNEVATPTVTVNNEVQTPSVTVNNEVPTPAVNVAAPNVSVHNEVQPADVKVELPTRQITSQISRNSDGDITKVVQTEKTVDE